MCSSPPQSKSKFASHPGGMMERLEEHSQFRLIIQPFTLFNLIHPWLTVFPILNCLVVFLNPPIVFIASPPIFDIPDSP